MLAIAPAVDVRLRSVLVATDFSKVSAKPLRHALAIARHYRAKLYIAHVVSPSGFTLGGPEAGAVATEAAWRDVERVENALAQSGALSGLRHEAIVRQGDVWEELDKLVTQEQVDLMVIGTRGRRGLTRVLFGSVAEQIFRHADCPVLTVGSGSFQEAPVESTSLVWPLLFATDFGDASLHALPHAISMANHFGVKLVLLHVAARGGVSDRLPWHTGGDFMQVRENARMVSLRRLQKLLPQNNEMAVEPEYVVEFGSPSEEILRVAENLQADAIIMGLHRSIHIDMASHNLWATAHEVICGATCPVLTVRSAGEITESVDRP
jgi:nucleotide-binding universal stress UspA family protein